MRLGGVRGIERGRLEDLLGDVGDRRTVEHVGLVRMLVALLYDFEVGDAHPAGVRVEEAPEDAIL
jgi:hypothetical protein